MKKNKDNNKNRRVITIIGLIVITVLIFLQRIKYYRVIPLFPKYEIMETNIDMFLETKDKDYLDNAKLEAEAILFRYKDSFPLALIKSYENIKDKNFVTLSFLRAQIKLIQQPYVINTKENFLTEAIALRDQLNLIGSLEAKKVDIVIAKYCAVTNSKDLIPLDILIKDAAAKNFLSIEAHLLLWKYKANQDKDSLNKIQLIAKNINNEALYISSTMTIAGIYEIQDQTNRAIKTIQEILDSEKYERINESTKISMMHILSISLSKERREKEAIEWIDKSIELSKEAEIDYSLALSYIIKSLILYHFGHKESDKLLDLASISIDIVNNKDLHPQLLTMVYGYKAKLNTNKKDSIQFYLTAIEKYSIAKNKNNYVLAQLYEALSRLAEEKAIKDQYKFQANYYLTQAELRKDQKQSSFFNYY